MDAFTKSPAELVARFDELVPLVPDASRRSMFGYPGLTMNGHLFFGLHRDRMVLRLADDDLARFTVENGPSVFEPVAGRPMRAFVAAPPALLAGPAIEPWLLRSAAHARTLPPKQPRSRAK